MHKYQILVEYSGDNFIGWQIQKKGKSVQKTIQIIISRILKEKIKVVGSGRTDAGVHALGQSAHFECKKKILNLNKYLNSINIFLNKKYISILSIKKKKLSKADARHVISTLNRKNKLYRNSSINYKIRKREKNSKLSVDNLDDYLRVEKIFERSKNPIKEKWENFC